MRLTGPERFAARKAHRPGDFPGGEFESVMVTGRQIGDRRDCDDPQNHQDKQEFEKAETFAMQLLHANV
jgi:hypothetical protein